MRLSVAIGVVFFAYLGVAAWFKAMPRLRRLRLGAAGTSLILAAVLLELLPASAWRTLALDWLPGVYLLAGYWLPAQLPARHAPRLARCLVETDRGLFDAGLRRLVERSPRGVLEYLEASYLCCYLIVPAGLAWLYLRGYRVEADRFWTAVLLPALSCYALLPWLQTRPPRSVEADSAIERRHPVVRRLNLVVLARASVGANTFPSGHAAASLAAALAVGAVLPAAGGVFGLVAVSISVASVVGRYHYALDVLLGALAAVGGFFLSRAG